MKNLLFTN